MHIIFQTIAMMKSKIMINDITQAFCSTHNLDDQVIRTSLQVITPVMVEFYLRSEVDPVLQAMNSIRILSMPQVTAPKHVQIVKFAYYLKQMVLNNVKDDKEHFVENVNIMC